MDIKISETYFDTVYKSKVVVAVFQYVGKDDPVRHLDEAIAQYTSGQKYYEFVDMNMDNPWFRIITGTGLYSIVGDNFQECLRNNRLDYLLE